jgi:hypothetical protein
MVKNSITHRSVVRRRRQHGPFDGQTAQGRRLPRVLTAAGKAMTGHAVCIGSPWLRADRHENCRLRSNRKQAMHLFDGNLKKTGIMWNKRTN